VGRLTATLDYDGHLRDASGRAFLRFEGDGDVRDPDRDGVAVGYANNPALKQLGRSAARRGKQEHRREQARWYS